HHAKRRNRKVVHAVGEGRDRDGRDISPPGRRNRGQRLRSGGVGQPWKSLHRVQREQSFVADVTVGKTFVQRITPGIRRSEAVRRSSIACAFGCQRTTPSASASLVFDLLLQH